MYPGGVGKRIMPLGPQDGLASVFCLRSLFKIELMVSLFLK